MRHDQVISQRQDNITIIDIDHRSLYLLSWSIGLVDYQYHTFIYPAAVAAAAAVVVRNRMKSSGSLLGLMSLVGVGSITVTAFSAVPLTVRTTVASSTTSATTTTTTTTTTSLHVSRRDFWNAAVTSVALTALTGATVTTLTAAPQPANAASLNFEQVQDLLGTPDNTEGAYQGGRPTFLVEPTADFKENEAKATIFKRQQLQAKQAFSAVMDKIATDPNDETSLVQDLDEMRRLVKQGGGLPAGILKDDVIRQVRRRKAKKYWPVNCEISYQDLMDEIRIQQSPNTERNMSNPM
jgi:hypothetical protein